MRIDVVTLFPELFDAPLKASIIGRAVENGLLTVAVHDLRQYGLGRHRSVDDYPYGGGAGMVLRLNPCMPRSSRSERMERSSSFSTPPGSV